MSDVAKAIVLVGVLIAFAVAFSSRHIAIPAGSAGAFVFNQWTGKVLHCDRNSCLAVEQN